MFRWHPLHLCAVTAIAVFYFSKSSQGPSLGCLASRGGPGLDAQPEFQIWTDSNGLTQLWNQRVSTKTLLNSRSSILFQVVSAYSDQTTIPTCTHFVGFCFLRWEFSRDVCFKVSKISEGILDILQATKNFFKNHARALVVLFISIKIGQHGKYPLRFNNLYIMLHCEF